MLSSEGQQISILEEILGEKNQRENGIKSIHVYSVGTLKNKI
jgi:hypothetical protein